MPLIVISDIKIYCEGLSKILASINPIEVISAESNRVDAIARINQAIPDVILLDMTMRDSCLIAQEVMMLCPEPIFVTPSSL